MIFYKKVNKIQAITFDLDDTLYNNHPVIKQANKKLQVWMSEHYPETAELDLSFWHAQQLNALKASPALKNDVGHLRYISLYNGFRALGMNESTAQIAAERSFDYFYFERSNFSVHQNVHSVLQALSSMVPLIAITNGNVDLDKIGLSPYFSTCFKASASLPMKPNRKMFDAAQQYLNIPHDYILHVGDNLEKDVYGALKAGYQTAWYAADRAMVMKNEDVTSIPHVQLSQLQELLLFI